MIWADNLGTGGAMPSFHSPCVNNSHNHREVKDPYVPSVSLYMVPVTEIH
jgi:hypothetical protein